MAVMAIDLEKVDAKDGLDEASGYTPPKEEMMPSWDNPMEDEHEDSTHEIRKRRLQHFEQQQGKSQNSHESEKESSDPS